MAVYKCEGCGRTGNQVDYELMAGFLAAKFNVVIPKLLDLRARLGLRTPDGLNAELLARMLLKEQYMCMRCFEASDAEESFEGFITSIMKTEADSVEELFEWKEIYP